MVKCSLDVESALEYAPHLHLYMLRPYRMLLLSAHVLWRHPKVPDAYYDARIRTRSSAELLLAQVRVAIGS